MIMTTLEFNGRCYQLEDLLKAFAMRLTMNREDAQDLYQETVMRAFVHKDRFMPGTNFKAWITTIMRNCFINEYRKRRTRNQVEQPLEENTAFAVQKAVDNDGPSRVMTTELKRLLGQLDEAHRTPFEMFFDGFEYQEIADTLQLPMGTVKSRIFFARKKLKNSILQHFGPEDFLRA